MAASRSKDDEKLRDAREQFVRLWGRMGSSWGIPRTMAQVHALLFIAGEPLAADDVMEQLSISRGNASMTLRRLVDWGLVFRVHRPADRKEYYVAEQDVWKLFRTILAERKKREIDPLLDALHACRQGTEPGPDAGSRRIGPEASTFTAHNERLDQLIEFMRVIESISQRFISPSGKGLELAAKLLARAS